MRDEHDEAQDGDLELHAFGELHAAAEAYDQMPLISTVTDGPDLRAVAFSAQARELTQGRLAYDQPILEVFDKELGGQGWAEAYRLPMATGETVTFNELRVQLQPPGKPPREVFIDVVFTPRLDAEGHPRGTILVGRDVTQTVLDRQAAERDLEDLRERYAVARGSVRTMQRALLADSVPVVPGLDIAARYVLASDEQAAGGDWFDAVARSDGSVVLVVGDVVGHGQSAAVAMGQLRSVLLAQLRAGSGVAEALEFLDGFAVTVPAARRATVCLVHVQQDGDVEYCTAGHPAPLVVAAEETDTRYLPPSGAGPLATGSAFEIARAHLEAGDAVVLYSDGILERPGVRPEAASVELSTTAANAQHNRLMPVGAPRSAAERICSLSIELLTRMSGHIDDITILAAQRQPAVVDLQMELEPTPDATQRAREAVREWLRDIDPDVSDVEALLHATTELVANVVDHAHLGSVPLPFCLRAQLEPGGVVALDVADQGSWKLPVITEQRGRGLALVRQLVDELEIERAAGGSTVSIRRHVTRPAGLLETGTAPVRRDPEHFDVWSQGGPEPVVGLVGPLDAAHTAQAQPYLDLALTEAAATVTVDLADVTLLASAGVDLLFRVIEQARAIDLDVELLAPNGSAAQHVLSLVRLPHQQTPSPA